MNNVKVLLGLGKSIIEENKEYISSDELEINIQNRLDRVADLLSYEVPQSRSACLEFIKAYAGGEHV